jgi:uncharacterized SAM-binding protein YcdF (DUF218 family)
MVVLSAVITTLLLSPLLFVVLCAVGVFLVGIGKRRAAVWLLSATLVALLALSTGSAHNLLMGPLERRYPPFPVDPPPVGAIVVLGSGVVDGSPDEGGAAALSSEALKRVVYGLRLYRGLGVPIVVSGGRVWNTGGESEADTAATLLARLGVPEGIVIRERDSRTTWENARDVAKVLAERKISRVALVTSAYHMPRAMLAFSRAGISCVAAPTDYRAVAAHEPLGGLMPSFVSLGGSFTSLREYVGIIQYRARR